MQRSKTFRASRECPQKAESLAAVRYWTRELFWRWKLWFVSNFQKLTDLLLDKFCYWSCRSFNFRWKHDASWRYVASRITGHPRYKYIPDPIELHADIEVVRIANRIRFGETLQPIPLEGEPVAAFTSVTLVDWGKMININSTVLREFSFYLSFLIVLVGTARWLPATVSNFFNPKLSMRHSPSQLKFQQRCQRWISLPRFCCRSRFLWWQMKTESRSFNSPKFFWSQRFQAAPSMEFLRGLNWFTLQLKSIWTG